MVPCDSQKIAVRRQESELEADAQLRQQRVDRADLNPSPPAVVSKVGGGDVVVALRSEEGKSREAVGDRGPRAWTPESLQEFLQNQPGREYWFRATKGLSEVRHLRC